MKKLIAILSVFVIAFSFASCAMSEEKRIQKMQEIESKHEAESIKVEQEISKKKEEVLDEIGKTKEGSRYVVRRVIDTGEEFMVMTFKNGKFDEKYRYLFISTPDIYKQMKEAGDPYKEKLVKTDDKRRMLVYKLTGTFLETYDEVVDYYTEEMGFTIVK